MTGGKILGYIKKAGMVRVMIRDDRGGEHLVYARPCEGAWVRMLEVVDLEPGAVRLGPRWCHRLTKEEWDAC